MREVNKNMLTKKYNNGFVTLDAKKFLSVAQDCLLYTSDAADE